MIRLLQFFVKDNPAVAQLMLEYVYSMNRIAAGIATDALDEDVVFNIWPPDWFAERWEQFAPFIYSERARRGQGTAGSYAYFQWLVMQRIPKVRAKYPQALKERP